MPAHGPLNFRQRDLAAAVKALLSAGQNVAHVTIQPDGTLTIYVAGANMPVAETTVSAAFRPNKALQALRNR